MEHYIRHLMTLLDRLYRTLTFKSPSGAQQTLSLIGKMRNIFAMDVGRLINTVNIQRENFQKAKSSCDEAVLAIAAA